MARLRRWLVRLFWLATSMLLLAALGLGVLYWLIAPRIPDVEELRNVAMQEPLSVHTRDGKLIALIGETRRYPVQIEQVPLTVKQAFIAIEDARFYEHPGVDWRGIGRAVWLLATTDDRRVPGGSTITQQVARQFFLSTEYSYTRKLTEIFVALKMERELSKDEIFELYLNKSFFGNRAYGVAAAAEFYYGKTLPELTLAEAAMLASIPKFPSSGNPIINPERALIRRNYVLQRMREENMISVAQERAAAAEPNTAARHEPRVEVEAPYLAEMVRAAMEEKYGEQATTSGYRVYTTVDSADQTAANAAVRQGLMEYDRRRGWRGPEGQLALADGEDEASILQKLRAYSSYANLLVAVVTGFEGEQARVLSVRGSMLLPADAARWTGKPQRQILRRGDVIRLWPVVETRPVTASSTPASAETAAAAAAAPAVAPEAPAEPRYMLAQVPGAQAALVSLAHEDGAVRALVGGFSFAMNKFNRATQAQRQPGSSFKPFVYAAAFERGYSPATIVLDAPVVFRDRGGRVWRPQNDAGNFAGPMRLREAMVQSRNLVSVRLLDAIGVDFARRYITNFGFSIDSLPPNLSMSLGTASLTPMSMARGYAAFANGGFRVEPYFIDRVLDRNGKEVPQEAHARACARCPERAVSEHRQATVVDGFDFSPGGPTAPTQAAPVEERDPNAPPPTLAPRAIDERTAFLMRSLMRDVVKRGTATAARVLEREDVGGKTGSTNNHRDAWFAGFGGDLVTAVWVGKDDFSSLGSREYGGKAALPVWIGYMRSALKDEPLSGLEPPPGIVTATINHAGRLIPDGTPGGLREYFKAEDFDRVTAAGFEYETPGNEEEAFDIF